MDCARVVAYSCKLLRLRVFGVVGVENGIDRPYAHITICKVVVSRLNEDGALRMSSAMVGERTSGCRNKTRTIG